MNLADKFMQQYGRPPTEFDPDYLEMLNMSKYRILDIPDKKQAKCANCGSTKNDGRKYVDFGLEVDWYGIVFLCSLCLQDITKNMGFYDSSDRMIKSQSLRILELTNLLLAQGDTIESKLSTLVEEVKEYFDALNNLTGGTSASSISISDVPSDKESNVEEFDIPNSATSRNTGKTSESAASAGSKNVSSLAELLKS